MGKYKEKFFSYQEYIKILPAQTDFNFSKEINKIVNRFQTQQFVESRFAPVIYMLDFTTKKYLYVDEGCFDMFGYTAKQWKEESIEGYLKKWHPQDLKIMNEYIFPENVRFLQHVPFNKYEDIIFSYNYRVLNANGEYVTILQRSSFIPGNEPGKPIATIGAAFDITHFKADLSVVHTIEEVRSINNRFVNGILYKKIYSVSDDLQKRISKREVEILNKMAEGLSSKQIADILNLSINTINNHRKNMLNKTECKTSAELLRFAFKQGYIQCR